MTNVTRYWKLLLTMGIVSYFLACSPHKFSHIEGPACRDAGVSCKPTANGTEVFTDTKTVGNGVVDILFVNDNSGSMSFEQNNMGSKFPNFISSLGQMDWRIAMITTDVSGPLGSNTQPARAANGNGKFRDGALLEFTNNGVGTGNYYVTKNTPNVTSVFNDTIRRRETIACEQSRNSQGYLDETKCPSSDERGIFAANLALDRNEHSFFRSTAPLAVVVLADEDVRSGLYSGGSRNTNNQPFGYELGTKDKYETLVSNYRARFPNKSITVHSIVVKEGDSGCLTTQNSQGANQQGSYGRQYIAASQATGGVIGTICSGDYGNELGQIAYEIQNQVTSMAFVCRPVNDQFTWNATPAPAQAVTATADFDRLVVEFDQPFAPGTKITLTYECEKN